jgi:hypothetical protein
MRIFLFYSILIFIFCFSSCNKIVKDQKIIGVKIYNHEGDLQELFEEWDRVGVNLVLSSPDLARKAGFMQLAQKHATRVFLIVPTFFNPVALDMDSSLYAIDRYENPAVDEWVRFICPNNEDYRRSHIEYLKKLTREIQPDGISIDFIRYFVFWEKVFSDQKYSDLPQTCFEDNCLTKFQFTNNFVFPDSCDNVIKKADFVLDRYEKAWVDFKCQTISGFVEEMDHAIKSVRPETAINFHAVPWRSVDFNGGQRSVAGQDLKLIAPFVDYISPMCYSHMLLQTPEWIHDVVMDFNSQVSQSKILPSIQVSKAYLDDPFLEIDFKKALEESLKPPSSGVVFWSWEALERSPEKLEIVAEYVSGM